MATHRSFYVAVLVAACLAWGGCGSSGSGLVEVTGQVRLDGEPLTTGMVTTTPERGRGARGVIGSDGRFTLNSGDLGRGASPGRHFVAVVATEPTEGLNPEAPKKLITPEKYANSVTSELLIEVVPGQTNDVVLELSSK